MSACSGREHFYPRELSGGQQQRVGIARSLATKPEIWFLDEPFSALDPLIRREMQDELMRLQTVLHKTIVFITHDFDEAIRLADRIAIMKDGEVIQIGTPEELVVNPATDYVAEFTRDVQRAKVISAQSLMHRLRTAPSMAARSRRTPRSPASRPSIVAAGKPFAVVNGTGKPIGEVTPQAVIDLLAGIGAAGTRRMTIAADPAPPRSRPVQLWLVVWAAALAAVLVVFLLRDSLPWAVELSGRRHPSGRRLGQRDHDLAQGQSQLADPLDHRGARRAARFRARPARQEFQDRPRRRGDRRCRACPGSASAPRRSSPAAPPAAGSSARWSAAASSTSRCSASGPAPC